MAKQTAKVMKTRHTSGSKMSEYLGPGKELLATEVPTLRAALRKALLIQEECMLREEIDRRNIDFDGPGGAMCDSSVAES